MIEFHPKQKQSFYKYSVCDIPSLSFSQQEPQLTWQMKHALLDGCLSRKMEFLDLWLDTLNLNSVFVKLRVSLLADSDVYILVKSVIKDSQR